MQVEQVWAKTQSRGNSSFRVSDLLGMLAMPWFPLLNIEPVFLGICCLWSVNGGVSSIPWQGQAFRSFFKNLFIFSWRIIALQYCVGFYRASTWIILSFVYLVPSCLNIPPPLPPSQPSRWLGSRFEFPESHRESPSAVYFTYGNVCFRVTLSKPPTLSFSPQLCSQVCSPCLCLHCCSANISTIFLGSMFMR